MTMPPMKRMICGPFRRYLKLATVPSMSPSNDPPILTMPSDMGSASCAQAGYEVAGSRGEEVDARMITDGGGTPRNSPPGSRAAGSPCPRWHIPCTPEGHERQP